MHEVHLRSFAETGGETLYYRTLVLLRYCRGPLSYGNLVVRTLFSFQTVGGILHVVRTTVPRYVYDHNVTFKGGKRSLPLQRKLLESQGEVSRTYDNGISSS